MNILDLNCYVENYLEIAMPSQKVLKIRKPTEKMVIEIMKYQQTLVKAAKHEVEPEALLSAAVNLTTKIIRSAVNADDADIEALTDLPYAAITAVINAYIDFMKEAVNYPNS